MNLKKKKGNQSKRKKKKQLNLDGEISKKNYERKGKIEIINEETKTTTTKKNRKK